MFKQISHVLARVEIFLAALLAAAVTLLILLNIVTRAVGSPLYWVNELAIHAMIWMTFLTTSAVLQRREGIAVTLLFDGLSESAQRWLRLFSDVMVVLFGSVLLWLCWRWFDLLGLFEAGFDVRAFQAETFNFVYSERSRTLGIPMVWSWLCLPLFALLVALHGSINLGESLARVSTRRSVS